MIRVETFLQLLVRKELLLPMQERFLKRFLGQEVWTSGQLERAVTLIDTLGEDPDRIREFNEGVRVLMPERATDVAAVAARLWQMFGADAMRWFEFIYFTLLAVRAAPDTVTSFHTGLRQ